MGRVARLLIVHHSPTRSTQALLESALAGAGDDAIEGVEVVVRPALEATADEVLAADGYLLGSPVNFGYMSGALKHFFDSTFLDIGGALDPTAAQRAAPGARSRTACSMHGRYDLTGAVRAVLASWGHSPWRQAAEVLEVIGEVGDAEREAAYELGATVAALLNA